MDEKNIDANARVTPIITARYIKDAHVKLLVSPSPSCPPSPSSRPPCTNRTAGIRDVAGIKNVIANIRHPFIPIFLLKNLYIRYWMIMYTIPDDDKASPILCTSKLSPPRLSHSANRGIISSVTDKRELIDELWKKGAFCAALDPPCPVLTCDAKREYPVHDESTACWRVVKERRYCSGWKCERERRV